MPLKYLTNIMKPLYIFIISLVCFQISVNAEGQNAFVPKKGIISFITQTNIYNQEEYETSIAKFRDSFTQNLKENIKREYQEKGLAVNEESLNSLIEMQNQLFEPLFIEQVYNNNKSYKYKFQDSLIISYEEIDNKIRGDYTIIYRESSQYNKLSKIDSTTFYLEKQPYPYRSENKIVDFIEEKTNRKTIRGYDCFKVILKVKEDMTEMDIEFQQIFKGSFKILEMYVTEDIKCSYHPIIKFSNVLEKYYPLEIIETDNLVEGINLNYQLIEMKLE